MGMFLSCFLCNRFLNRAQRRSGQRWCLQQRRRWQSDDAEADGGQGSRHWSAVLDSADWGGGGRNAAVTRGIDAGGKWQQQRQRA